MFQSKPRLLALQHDRRHNHSGWRGGYSEIDIVEMTQRQSQKEGNERITDHNLHAILSNGAGAGTRAASAKR